MKFVNHQGAHVPALGFGTFRMQGEECYNATRWALECGYRHLDTAQGYDNEQDVGRALADSGLERSAVFLTTKCHKDKLTADAIAAELEISLDKLHTDHVDLLLIHWPSAEVPLAETMGALRAARDDGKARHIGVSNFTIPLMREAAALVPGLFTNQIEYHPLLRQKAVNETVFELGMVLSGHSPIATGRLVDNPVIAGIARKHGKSVPQVAIRWQLEQHDVIVIPKSRRREIIAENFDVFDFALDADDMAAIETLPHDDRGVAPPWSPNWDPND